MGRSASKLSSTRSGTVTPRFSAAAITRLSSMAPIPPLALLHRQPRVPRLRHRRAKDIQTANVLRLSRDLAELFVEPLRIPPGKLSYGSNAEQLKVAQHSWPNGNQVSQRAFFGRHKYSP